MKRAGGAVAEPEVWVGERGGVWLCRAGWVLEEQGGTGRARCEGRLGELGVWE